MREKKNTSHNFTLELSLFRAIAGNATKQNDRGEKKDTVPLFPTVSPCAPPYLNVGDRPFGLKTMNATVEVKNKNCSSLT